ncbi:response regulator [Oscillatoria sp. FACHB-1407]|nr:response regulator [Oscillatoria sp. FACHB-1407]
MVEDSDEDFETLQRLLRRAPLAVPLHRCLNGDQALAFLTQTKTDLNSEGYLRPNMILLDLNLPGTDGREVLRQVKQDDDLKSIPVVVFTTSNNPKDINACYQYGVDKYIVKSIDFKQLKQDIQMLVDYWFKVTT